MTITRRLRRAVVAFVGVLAATAAVVLGAGSAAWAGQRDETQPVLAQTGYDFTPMLVTAAVVLLVAGVVVLIAKYALARSSHS